MARNLYFSWFWGLMECNEIALGPRIVANGWFWSYLFISACHWKTILGCWGSISVITTLTHQWGHAQHTNYRISSMNVGPWSNQKETPSEWMTWNSRGPSLPNQVGLMVETSHPHVIGLVPRKSRILRTYKRILREQEAWPSYQRRLNSQLQTKPFYSTNTRQNLGARN